MQVYRISKCQYINDLSGKGAASFSGRWHNKGTYILYTAASASLALLESVVHISRIMSKGYCMISLQMPDNMITELNPGDLPDNWLMHPPPDNVKVIGDNFISENKFLALKIPSAIMPEESNYLLNPNHPDFKLVSIISKRTIPIDERLLKGI